MEDTELKPYFTKDHFFDCMGRRVQHEDALKPYEYGSINYLGMPAWVGYDHKGGFKMWHVEYPHEVNIEKGSSYLELPQLDIRNKTDQSVKEYNDLLTAAWTHVPWHESHSKSDYNSLAVLNQEVSQTIERWRQKAPAAGEVARKRFLVAIENVSKLIENCDYGAAKKYLISLKWEVQNATLA